MFLLLELKLHKLSDLLNAAPDPYGIKTVAIYCNLSRQELTELEMNAAGGGHVIGTFLNVFVLQKGDLPTERLLGCFEAYEMERAKKVLQEILVRKTVKYIEDLTPLDLDVLARALIVSAYSPLPDWKTVAEYFEMQDQIPSIKSAIRVGNQFDRTWYLINVLQARNWTIGPFLEVVRNVGNVRAVFEIERQLNEMANRANSRSQ